MGHSTSVYTSSFVPSSFDESSQSFPSSNISDVECNISFEAEQRNDSKIEQKTEPLNESNATIEAINELDIEIGMFQQF